MLRIPAKPENVTWTDDQWKAIWAKGQDILVAAAAGSGKTAVLVERIINKILSTEDPLDVDELLVVTFTNASAAEMRHRIGEALEKAINENPSSKHLRKQLSLLNRASISTLHSFCLEVIRKYYYKVDVDPGFRIADETEAQLLRDEVLEELFEEEYGKEGNEAFFSLVDTFTNDRTDDALQEIIRDIYDFSKANPSPEGYLQSMVDMYEVPEGVQIEEFPFMAALMFDIQLQLKGAVDILQRGLEITKLPGGPAPRAENFIDDLKQIDSLLEAAKISWDELYLRIQSISFTRAKACKGDEFDKDLIEQSQKLRDKAKKLVQTLKDELFSRKPESFIRDMKEMAPHIHTLVTLVESFSTRFDDVKKEKGIVDFADLEHYCLQILSEINGDGEVVPSDAALNYRNHFKEVFVDEYQDTNMVQEAILKLVTKEGEHAGNMFMVGDVKQSIYRFRLAEPNLFLGKYLRFTTDGEVSGLKIDLAKNFRSRKEVLDGTNYLFKQIMGTSVGEIEYDEAAELVNGAHYPEGEHPIELVLIEQQGKEETEEDNEEEASLQFDASELEQSQLEAKVMAGRIKELIAQRKDIYNGKTKSTRPIMYRDIVILLRSMTWAPAIMEEFKEQGIPIYANLSNGYFEATEVSIMMSLLKIIDNPYQDIPLAAVLRSPIVGLNEEELATIRTSYRQGSFYEAVLAFSKNEAADLELNGRIRLFLEELQEWRKKARQGALAELIWQLYRETKFYDFVGGLPGGKQRQANLRALYDRAKQYENTSFRGLFRFLRFIERMRDRGDDLGAARALGEQEDVVRIMTIHSSKGLEFPVVFIAGTARQFNMMDLRKSQMLDKEYGFATKYVNAEKRISYPSLPQLAFKRKKKLEMLAEEMRILYVALTRAKEKLFLLASVKELDKKLANWSHVLSHQEWLLKEYDRATAKSYLDWIGPALMRHKNSELLHLEKNVHPLVPAEITNHPSAWRFEVFQASDIASKQEEKEVEENSLLKNVFAGSPVHIESSWKESIVEGLSWRYSNKSATYNRSKQSVSEMKRQQEIVDEASGNDLTAFTKPISRRPRFMQEKTITPAERGTAMHMVMQHVELDKPITLQAIESLLQQMIEKELLTKEQIEVIDAGQIVQFFQLELGERMLSASSLKREVPFSAAFPSHMAYPDWKGDSELILVQGVIDCVFETDDGLVLVDYKTDGITDRFKGGFEQAKPILEKRYHTQIGLYTQALEQILKKKVTEKYLYFFDGGHTLKL